MTTCYRQRRNLPARNVQGVMAVITPGSSQIHRLNDSAAALFERCAGEGATLSELVTWMLASFEVSPEDAEPAVQSFLEDAVARGILERCDSP